MAQAGFTPLLLYVNTTTSTAPSAGNLTNGELALNSFTGKLYYKTPAGAVTVLADASLSSAVLSLSFGTTGLTPSTATSGAITVAGTLVGANGGTGQSTYALGDLLYGTASNTLSKLTLGTSGQVLTAGASAPQYVAQSTLSVGTATNLAGGTTGSVPYQTGAGATGMLSIGAAYTIVAANAGATAPTFQSLTSLIDNAFTASAQGTVLYRGASNWVALAPGTAGNVLTSGGAGANVSWGSAGGAGVTSFQTSLNGLTPSASTTGAVTLAGTLGATSGGTGQSTYATGDIIYASATNTLSKLAVSTNGYVLTLVAGVPAWAAASGGVSSFSAGTTGFTPNTATTGAVTLAGTLIGANGGTGQSTYALGDLLYGTASNTLSKLTLGTSGQVLTAGASAPQYVAQSTLSVGTATNVAGGLANQVHYQTGAGATSFIAAPSVASTFLSWTGSAFAWSTVGLSANATVTGLLEATNVVAAAPSTTQNIDVITSSVWYYTANTSANWILNLRGNSGTSLNTVMAVGTAITVVFAATNSTTAYYQTAIQVDGATQTVRWQGGSAPASGNTSSVDIYTMTVFKTSATPTYSVFASQVRFA